MQRLMLTIIALLASVTLVAAKKPSVEYEFLSKDSLWQFEVIDKDILDSINAQNFTDSLLPIH